MKLVRPPFGTPSPKYSMMSISAPPSKALGMYVGFCGCIQSDACWPWRGWNLMRAATTPYLRNWWPSVDTWPLRR